MRNANLSAVAALLLFAASTAGADDAGIVKVGDFEVVTLQEPGPGGVSPAERAELATRRLERALLDPETGPEHVRVEVLDGQALVLAGRIPVLTVSREDARRNGSTPVLLAEHWAGLLRGPFAEAKTRRFSIRLLMRYLVAMTYPILFLGVVAGLRLGRRAGLAALYRVREDGPSPLRLGGVELVSRKGLLESAALGLRAGIWAALIASTYVFLVATFYHFPATRTLGLGMFNGLADAVLSIANAVTEQVGWILSAGLVLTAVYGVLKLLNRIFDAIESGKLKLAPYITQENADAVETIANGLVYLLAVSVLILLLPGEGSRLGLGVLAFLGLALAIASAPILRQFMSGISLAFLGSHRFGSRVLWQGREATLLRRRLFHTVVRMRDGRRCLVPNHEVLASAVLPAEGSQESLAFEVKVAVEDQGDARLLEDLAGWAAEFGDGAAVKLVSFEDGMLHIKVLVPALVATDDQFMGAAYAGLRDLAARGGSRLVALRPQA